MATQKNKTTKTKAAIKEAWSHDDLMTYLKDHPETMDLETVSTIRAENNKFSEADKKLLYLKYLKGLRGASFAHYYHFWTFFHSDLSKAGQAELAAEIIKETGKNFNEHTLEIEYDSCSYFLPFLIEGARDWYRPSLQREARMDSIRSMQLWGVVKLMERNTGWLFAHVGRFSFNKDLMSECDSFRQYTIPYMYDLNPEQTAIEKVHFDDKYLGIQAQAPQPLGTALNIYQIVLNYYSNDTLLRDRLILADLMRLQFVNTCFSGPSAKTAWREAIQRLLVHNGTNSSSTLVAAQLANYLFRLSKENESPEQGSAASWYRYQAYHTAKQFADRFPEGLGTKACRMIMRDISESNFSAELDQQWYPNSPTLLKLKYKNMHHLYVYVFDLKNPNDTSANPTPGTLVHLQQFSLKDFDDFYEHRTQLAISGLPAGKYYVELADTVLTYEDAARLAAYIIVAPAKVTYYTTTSGKREVFAVDCKTGHSTRLKNFNVDSLNHFPVIISAKKECLVGAKNSVTAPSTNDLNLIKHQLPAPALSLNKAAYLPGDLVECVAKISPKEYAQFVHLGGYAPLLLNEGQAINIPAFNRTDNPSVRNLYWYNSDHQFVVRFYLDSILKDGDYMLQIGDASIKVPVRNNFEQGTFSIHGPSNASFDERMHFTAKWAPAKGHSYRPKNVEVSIALLEFNFGKAGVNRHVSNQTVQVGQDGSFIFDYVPVANAESDENNNQEYLARYTFTWRFLDSNGQSQLQYNRYYISYPEYILHAEVPSKIEANALLEYKPVFKAIGAEGLLKDSLACQARIIRLRPGLLTPVENSFVPDYYTMSVDSFRLHFPFFSYAGETNIENLTLRDTLLTKNTFIYSEQVVNTFIPTLESGVYLLQLTPTDPRQKTVMCQNRFKVVNPNDTKNPSPEWLSISYHKGAPYLFCAQKEKELQVYFFSDKGILKHKSMQSSGKWTKLKCPSGTRSVVVETYIDGKHIVRSWAYPEIEELL